jgi:hypothetical protein
MTIAAAKIRKKIEVAAKAMRREHRLWFERAIGEIERRTAIHDDRERRIAEREAWISRKGL